MKKVVRLSEQDLVKLIKRVIKEDSSPRKVDIKIKVTGIEGYADQYFDIYNVIPEPSGCKFTAHPRGRQESLFVYWNPNNRNKVYSDNIKGNISDRAANMLEVACGNKEYASKTNTDSSNYA